MPNKLHRQVKGLAQGKSDKLNLISGSLGITINGQKTVEVPNRDGYVFVRLRGSQSELIQAYNASVSPIYDLPVLLTRQGNHYAVYGRDLEQYNNWGNTPYLPKHGTQHSFAPELGLGGDVTWIYSRQFVPMLAMPSGSAGAASLVVNPYIYRNPSDGSFEYIGNQGTSSFLPAKPSNNQARMVLLYWDLNLNTTGMITGSLFAEGSTGTASITPYIPYMNDSEKIPLVAVRLVSGTTTLGWDNIYDVRQFTSNTAPPFGGGFGVWDEGISQGTGTIFNFTGAGVVASVSGSIVNVNISGGSASPPITGSVVIQDEGIVKGSALTINFVGVNVDASVSGSVARVFITGSVGGGTTAADMWTSGSVGVGIRPSNVSGGNDAVGSHSLAHGNGAVAVGLASHAEGQGTLASGTASHADGSGSQAYGSASYAGGSGNKAVGNSSFVTGEGNIASGTASFISGASNKAMSPNSAALGGANNLVTGDRSVVLGGQNMTGSASDTAYMNLANVRVLNSGTAISNVGINAQGFLVTGSISLPGVGTILNGKLSVTVASNDLTVALKTLAGTDASASNPILANIDGTIYTITAALSITIADGTSWFGAGSAETGTLAVPYFVYLVWDSNSSAVALSIARKPYFNLVSETDGTATSNDYLYDKAAFTSTDPIINIGYFEAVLSLTGTGHLWTVPTFVTGRNLKHQKTEVSQWCSWTPTITGFSANPTLVCSYRINVNAVDFSVANGGNGTSNAATFTITFPLACTLYKVGVIALPVDAGVNAASGVYVFAVGATMSLYKSAVNGWTATLGKAANIDGMYKI